MVLGLWEGERDGERGEGGEEGTVLTFKEVSCDYKETPSNAQTVTGA